MFMGVNLINDNFSTETSHLIKLSLAINQECMETD